MFNVQPRIYLVTCTFPLSRSHTRTILLLTVILFVLASTSTKWPQDLSFSKCGEPVPDFYALFDRLWVGFVLTVR